LTVEAVTDPTLLAACPNCGRELQLNPFIVDNRESQKYKVIDIAIPPLPEWFIRAEAVQNLVGLSPKINFGFRSSTQLKNY